MPRKKNKEQLMANAHNAALASLSSTQQGAFINALQTINSTLSQRSLLSRQLGETYGGDRNLYEALGYKTSLSYVDYLRKYQRQDIAQRIIDAYPDATWHGKPIITDDEDPKSKTKFDKAVDALHKSLNIFTYCTRVDKLSRIGQYAVLFLGFDDAQEKMTMPAGKSKGLLYLQPYSFEHATIKTYVTDAKDPRFGLPEMYQLHVQDVAGKSAVGTPGSTTYRKTTTPTQSGLDATAASGTMLVHHSRVLHVAGGLLESNVFGTPVLESIFNRLEDLEKLLGGSAEMFWRGAWQGLGLEMDKDASMTPAQIDALDDTIDNYTHKLTRVLKVQGMEIKDLAPNISSPRDAVDVQMDMIAGAKAIPKRILTGSERGELASSQDVQAWNTRVDERRTDFAEPEVLRKLVDRFIEVGILPKPAGGDYVIQWPLLAALSPKEQAEVAEYKAKTLKAYVESGAAELLPPTMFLTKVLGLTEAEADEALKLGNEGLADEAVDLEEARALFDEQQAAAKKAASKLATAEVVAV